MIDLNATAERGIELCRSLRPEALVPLLVFISHPPEAQILAAYQAGADELVCV